MDTIIHDPTAFVLLCLAGAILFAGTLLFALSLGHAAKCADEQRERMLNDMTEAEKQAQAHLDWLLNLKDGRK